MRSSDDSARRPAPQPRRGPIDLRLSLVHNETILPVRAEPPTDPPAWVPAAEVLGAAAAVAERAGAFVLGGGDPLRRGDLLELLDELARLRPEPLGLCLPGAGATAAAIERLRAAGVARVLVPFHCARQDAHDWLVGRSGALKAAHRAIRAGVDAGLAVTAEVVLTRPTAPHLTETVVLLARLGVRTISVRRLSAADAGPQFVPLSPRLGLLPASLERAAEAALERRVRLRLRDLPLCVAPRLRPLFAAADSELWVQPDGTVAHRSVAAASCAACPGPPQCAGVPADYAARFGWEEVADARTVAARVQETVAAQRALPTSAPMTFAWRGPQRVRCEPCADTADSAGPEPTRAVRARLVQAARFRPAVLRVVGADLLAHPQAVLLLFDAVRLFPRVEVAGEASALVDWSELDLRRLKALQRIDVALYGPDAASHDAHCGIPGAFAAMQRGVERLRAHTSIPVGAYAILHDAGAVAAFAAAWERGALPGTPRFRLSPRGGSLDALLDAAQALPAGAARAALLAVLPACRRDGLEGGGADGAGAQQQVVWGRSVPYRPCGSDPVGSFELCEDGSQPCSVPGCVGTASGWHSPARSKRWTASI